MIESAIILFILAWNTLASFTSKSLTGSSSDAVTVLSPTVKSRDTFGFSVGFSSLGFSPSAGLSPSFGVSSLGLSPSPGLSPSLGFSPSPGVPSLGGVGWLGF